ncbi:MAG: RsmB/NOP family class I SAM-dependent RNA methyltransferase [Sphingomonadales bacterium]|nr:RsmB/NOP family class I SAM-dependent RNA methyltransferase [Sphingomonadales bacterium]
MTPQARVQAGIEILDLIIAAARGGGASADKIVADWFRARRFAGSKDRRAVRELVYGAIRACGDIPRSGRAAMLRLAELDPSLIQLFDGTGHGPQPVASGEVAASGGIAPSWLEVALADSGVPPGDALALLDRAPLDIRVNALKADRSTIMLPVSGEPLAVPQGLRLPAGTPVEQWPQFAQGLIEIQDAGSQLACLAAVAQPGETIIDLCAGAGGKTLALAAQMANRGRLIACDTDRSRLSRLMPRAERAGIGMVETRLLDPNKESDALVDFVGTADAVVVDAPCSGTGTWRRNPEGRWRINPREVARYAATQARLLDLAATLLRPGGRLIFITCSLLDAEGTDQVDAFMIGHSQWRVNTAKLPAGSPRGAGWRLSPWADETDGFFIACFDSPC